MEETFEYYVICSSKEEKEKIIESLLEILLYNGKLIQGTPLAPAVSNIIFRSIDIRIWSADTMTFTEYRCQILHLMYADTPIAPIWQNRE